MKVFTYHNVGTPPKQARLKTLYVRQSQLERQIRLSLFLGYRFINLKELLQGNYDKRSILLTFDDAYKDFIELAYPVLKKYGVPAVVFAPASLVGEFNRWDYENLRVKKPIMGWEELRFLVKEGFEIGSHSLNHPFLSKIDPSRARREIEDSKKLLEDKLGIPIDAFCYPYGDYDERVRDMVAQAGYRIAFTTRHGKYEESPNPFEIRRITIFGNDILFPKYLLKLLT